MKAEGYGTPHSKKYTVVQKKHEYTWQTEPWAPTGFFPGVGTEGV